MRINQPILSPQPQNRMKKNCYFYQVKQNSEKKKSIPQKQELLSSTVPILFGNLVQQNPKNSLTNLFSYSAIQKNNAHQQRKFKTQESSKSSKRTTLDLNLKTYLEIARKKIRNQIESSQNNSVMKRQYRNTFFNNNANRKQSYENEKRKMSEPVCNDFIHLINQQQDKINSTIRKIVTQNQYHSQSPYEDSFIDKKNFGNSFSRQPLSGAKMAIQLRSKVDSSQKQLYYMPREKSRAFFFAKNDRNRLVNTEENRQEQFSGWHQTNDNDNFLENYTIVGL